ncbi:hypothetical protein HMPREF0083_04651 [Aneurinibacillus aneurinilyticus ATCC 12856]|jgi:hypothetical protein|uniref:Uncharacterized protein n=1 Tax=Aneurinibacillus aneurinilyticus ATCC 12856 TaxID=649747 RepID=U1Y8Z7_ANEAE|nr:hypothetical protein HMPREF0083_04651 [Aneurinibacillus aneurinilyticus ATCC 12856]
MCLSEYSVITKTGVIFMFTIDEKKWLALVLRDTFQDGADVADENIQLYESIMSKLED